MPTPRPTKGRGVRPQYTVKVKDKKSSLATVAPPTEIWSQHLSYYVTTMMCRLFN